MYAIWHTGPWTLVLILSDMKDQLIVKRMYYFTNVLDKLCQLQGGDSIAFDDMWWMKQIQRVC